MATEGEDIEEEDIEDGAQKRKYVQYRLMALLEGSGSVLSLHS